MDWNDRLNQAQRVGSFTERDMRMAGSWLTCAVGERAAVLNLDAEDDPSDAISRHGIDFMYAVTNQDPAKARRLFHLIQRWGARRQRREAIA